MQRGRDGLQSAGRPEDKRTIQLETQIEIVLDKRSVVSKVFSRRKPSRNCLADIEQYFQQPPPQFLDLELAVCWVLECLLKDDNYPSGLLQELTQSNPQLRLSETVLQQALAFLEQEGSITTYTSVVPVEVAPGGCSTCNRKHASKPKSSCLPGTAGSIAISSCSLEQLWTMQL